MKLLLSKILFIGILLQIFATQGILMFNIFKIFGNWELKSFIHPIGVVVCLLFFICKWLDKGIRFSSTELLLFTYLLLSIILLIINVDSALGFYVAFREVILVFLLILIYSKSRLSVIQWRKILKLLYLLTLLNILFIGLTFILGPEQFMTLVTGRFSWPVDLEYKFKISNFYLFWRSPGLIGESAAVGVFGILSYFLFIQDEKFKNRRIYPFVLVILSFTRSIYLALVIFLFLKFILKKKNLRRLEIIVPYSLPLLLLALIPLYNYNLLSIKSIVMRINHWLNDIDVNYNLIFGGAIGKVGGAVVGEGFIATMDSYWLFMLTSVGLLGIILVILFLYEMALESQTQKLILISLFFTCFLVTITQSIPFLVLFPLIFINRSFFNNDKV